MADVEGKGGVVAVERATSIVLAFRRDDDPLTLAAICTRTGLSKTTAIRLLASLGEAGIVSRLPNKRYRLGSGVLRLGRVFNAMTTLPDAARGPAEALMRRTNLSVSLYVRKGESRVCVYRSDPPDLPLDAVRVGDARPLDETSTGLTFRRFAEGTNGAPVVPIFTVGVYNPGMASLAHPIFSADDRLAGVLTVSASVTRLALQRVGEIAPLAAECVGEIENALGRGPDRLDQ